MPPVSALVLQPPDLQPTNLLARLAEASVDFVVIGGVAVALQGHVRFTKDLDIVYALDDENLERLGAALLDLEARLRGVEEAVPFVADARTLRRTEILTLDTALGGLDLLRAPAGAPPYAELRERALVVRVADARVRVAAIEHLISMKRRAGRPTDLTDVTALEALLRLRRSGDTAQR
jgi:hypothetical protein